MQCKNVPVFSSYYHITGDLRFTEAKKWIAKEEKIAVRLQKFHRIKRIIKEQKWDIQKSRARRNR
jgi:chlorite dismutase